MPTRDSAAPTESARFPVVAVLEVLHAWQRDPTGENLERVREAFRAVLSASGARGAWLEVEAELFPRLRVGAGTLRQPPSDTSLAELTEVELRVDGGRRSVGRIWLDDPSAEARARAAGTGPRPVAPADAIELALDAAWSRETVHRTIERLEALDAATRGIAGVLSVDRVLQLIVDRTRDLVGSEYAALGIADTGGTLERFVTSGIGRVQRESIGAPPQGHGLLGLIIREGRTFRIADIARDPRSHGFPSRHPSMRSFLGVPIMVKGRSVGDLYLTNKRGADEFSESDQALVETFALHAGIAIENARLHEQVQRLAVVEERERIGKDLHDGIIQGIYGVGLSLEDVPELMDDDPDEARARIERAIERLNLTIRDIRNFIFGLRPELLEQVGLVGGLAALADEFRLNAMVDVEIAGDETAVPDLGHDATLQVLHIAREALSNIARHANATRARITLSTSVGDGEVRLEIGDNGRGFAVDDPRGPSHQGLQNMRARAEALGGRLEIDSEPHAGTRIIVIVPRPRDA